MPPWVARSTSPRTADSFFLPARLRAPPTSPFPLHCRRPLARGGTIIEPMSPRPSPRDLRASDTDRDRVLSMLGEAMSDGRLTADEHAERVQRAIAART
ncbi:MAG: DUF1707 SHOCT-like domain-containing protein, partial [Streptosporangiaceae bacterium]